MYSLEENIVALISKIVEKNEFFLIDIVLRGTEHNRVIEVFVDGIKDVTAEDCAKISQEIDLSLQALLAKHPNYRLEVSSPGIDRPLKFLKQYPKHINRKFELTYLSGNEAVKFAGKLMAVQEGNLTFTSNNNSIIINFNNIIKANLVVSFS
jgi:ribosome maturation factor RimP